MLRKILFGMLVLLAVAMLVLNLKGTAFLTGKNAQPVSATPGIVKTIGPDATKLPIPLDNQLVTGLSLNYSLIGSIKSLNSTIDGMEVVLDTPVKDLPVFVISSTTKVIKLKDGQQNPAVVADLVVGLKINLHAVFDTKKLNWLVPVVYIVPQK